MITDAVKYLQHELNLEGFKLTEDGVYGPVTDKAFKEALAHPRTIPTPTPPVIITPQPGTKAWEKWFKDRIGWTEFDHDKELAKGWKYCGLNYTSVIGNDRQWCAMSVNTALAENGYKGTHSAGAASFASYGTACGYVEGAILALRHTSGGHHVTLFLYWVDEANKIAACLGGNQNNSICIQHYNLSGNKAGHDEVMTTPRWPVEAQSTT